MAVLVAAGVATRVVARDVARAYAASAAGALSLLLRSLLLHVDDCRRRRELVFAFPLSLLSSQV